MDDKAGLPEDGLELLGASQHLTLDLHADLVIFEDVVEKNDVAI